MTSTVSCVGASSTWPMTIPSGKGRNGDLSITIILLKSESTLHLSRSISPSIAQNSNQALFPKCWDDPLLFYTKQAFEQLIATATEAAQLGVTQQGGRWGPREIVAHLAGWEVMAAVRIPKIVAGMPPLEESNKERQAVMNDAINATIVTMIGDQSLSTVCGILRQAYQCDLEILRKLDDTFFQPGEYVYERTRSVIAHCQEHGQELTLSHP